MLALLGQCQATIERVVGEYAGDASTTSSATSSPTRAKSSATASTVLSVGDNEIEKIRRTLRSPSARGTQTTGWIIRPDGNRYRLLSGPDDDPHGLVRKAEELVRQHLPAASGGAVSLARHVEVKVAMRMRETGDDQEVVVVDKKVCGRSPDTVDQRYSCDRYLSFFLPTGSILTVIEHDGTRVEYRGRGPR
jgi:hypothetical protein